MNDRFKKGRLLSNVGHWAAAALTPLVVLGVAVFVWEAATAASLSIARPIAEFSGVLDAEAMRVRAEEEARYTELIANAEGTGKHAAALEYEPKLRLATQSVDRLSRAYEAIFNSYGDLAREAYRIEGDLIRLQSRQISNTQFIDVIAGNIASIGCYAERYSGDYAYGGACDAADNIRRDIAGAYVDPLQSQRTVLPERLLAGFPMPRDLLEEDFARTARTLDAIDASPPAAH